MVSLRQVNARARAVAAQAAIIMTQAMRASRAVSQATAEGAGPDDRDTAGDELRTYMMMLLVGAPVLIDARVSRAFLEQAQVVAADMARAAFGFMTIPDAAAAEILRWLALSRRYQFGHFTGQPTLPSLSSNPGT